MHPEQVFTLYEDFTVSAIIRNAARASAAADALV
jgi:hypothetical protein